MICPNCGTVQSPEVPEISTTKESLGCCNECDTDVFAAGTSKFRESSPQETVDEGHRREATLSDVLLQHEPGDSHEDRGNYEHIDRAVYDEDGDLLYFAEIRERSCTLNGYRKTKFPFNKIEASKTLLDEHNVPVYIYIVFTDAWTRLPIKNDADYESGDEPFAPNYRPWQEDIDSQVPVKYPVEDLEVLSWGYEQRP